MFNIKIPYVSQTYHVKMILLNWTGKILKRKNNYNNNNSNNNMVEFKQTTNN